MRSRHISLNLSRTSTDIFIRGKAPLTRAVFTIVVGIGANQRTFGAHEEYLWSSPFFANEMKRIFYESSAKRFDLPDEEPEAFSCVLEYLYNGDYTPRMLHDKRKGLWYLDGMQALSPQKGGLDPTMYHSRIGDVILRDTAIYCAAERYGLPELKRMSLRKQGLHSGIGVAVILRSARFAYDNTPEHDGAVRAHYLAMIIRSRKTFKRSGTMQQEMGLGGKIWWDLFVAMCNHMDDLSSGSVIGTPRTV